MDQPTTSLRQEFINERLNAAERYLNKLAESLVSDIQQKKGKTGKRWVLSQWDSDESRYEPTMSFSDPVLDRVTIAEVLKMDAYKRLNEICARPDVDMCLGSPFGSRFDDKSAAFEEVIIFTELPYAASQDAAAKRRAAQKPAPKRKLLDKLLRRHRQG